MVEAADVLVHNFRPAVPTRLGVDYDPTQIALANAVFRPSDAKIAAALRVVEAARGAEANGVGAFLVDGRMIDVPFITRAEAILGAARRLGVRPAS